MVREVDVPVIVNAHWHIKGFLFIGPALQKDCRDTMSSVITSGAELKQMDSDRFVIQHCSVCVCVSVLST